MKLYFLGYTMNYDGCVHHGIFSSKEKAESYKNFLIKTKQKEVKFLDWHYYIMEYEIDPEETELEEDEDKKENEEI